MGIAQHARLIEATTPEPFEAALTAIAREEADKIGPAMVAPLTAGIDRLERDYRAWIDTFHVEILGEL